MKCLLFQEQLCDYLDRTLDVEAERAMETHASGCSSCAEELADAELVFAVMRETPAVEPPPQLVADIIHETIGVSTGSLEPAGGGRWGFLGTLLHPFGQPRFVMGMAMTMLSFSMFTFYGQRAIDEWNQPTPSPTVALVEGFSDDVSGLWGRAKEMTNSAVDFYELQKGAVVVEDAPKASEGDR